jgi:hypothetical protein
MKRLLKDSSSRGEYVSRLTALLDRGLSRRAAETVIDAAMFGLGCTEGVVREAIQIGLDLEKNFSDSIAKNRNLLERMGDL